MTGSSGGLTRVLRAGAGAVLAVALLLGVVVDGYRISWDRGNDRFIAVVRADDLSTIPLSTLAQAGVSGVGLRASALARGEGLSPDAVRRAGLIPVLIVDQAVPPGSLAGGAFPYFWIDGAIGAGDPLVQWLVGSGSTLIRREFEPRAAEVGLWSGGYRRFVRGHEIPRDEIARLTFAGMKARFVRAVRERGIRVLILSPYPGDPDVIAGFKGIIEAVEREGLSLGPPALPFPVPPRWVGIAFHLGVSALFLLLFLELFPQLPLAGLLLAGGIAAAAFGIGDVLLRQFDALLLAAAAPVYASVVLHPRGGIRGGLGYVVAFSGMGIAFAGLLAAILAHPAFMLKIYQFRGVKTALLLPPLGAVLLHLWQRRIGLRELIRPGNEPWIWPVLRAGGVLLGLAGAWFILVRSGNAPGLTSPLERETRGLLERLLFARPRFKEFLIGHPALFMFGTRSGSPFMRTGYLFFGMFGQASILNSFSHAHTPLLISLLRTVNGLGIGILFGVALYGAISLFGILRRGRR